MKNYFTSGLIVAMMVVLFASCHKASTLTFSQDKIVTSLEGEKGEILIKTDGRAKVVHVPDWMTAEIAEDSILRYSIRMNTAKALREDSIIIEAKPLTQAIYVKQKYKATYVKLMPEVAEGPIEGGIVKVVVETDGNGALQVSDATLARVEGDTVFVKTKFNEDPREKVTSLQVRCEEVETTLKVVQPANKCQRCGGSGHLNKACSVCNGAGFHICCNYSGKENCPKCYGTGWIVMRYNEKTGVMYE